MHMHLNIRLQSFILFDFVRSIAPGQIVRGGSEREETQQQDEVMSRIMEVRITQMLSLNNSPIQV